MCTARGALLRQRVDAGIGAPGPIQLEVLAPADLTYRPIDLTLDRASVLLDLPATVSSPCVLDQEPEARHAPVWTSLIRGASPLGLPTRALARRFAGALSSGETWQNAYRREGGPIAWLARTARSHLGTSGRL